MEKYGNNLMEYEINLNKILRLVKENMLSITLWMVMGLFTALITIMFIVTPKYSATIDLLVNQKSDNQQAQYTMQQADLQSINTYKDILKKSVILDPVLKQANKKDNYKGNLKELQSSISVANEVNSQVISVSVVDTNPYVARDIANMIGETFTKKIKKMMEVDNVTIVTKAVANTKPISPNKKLYLLIGMIIGFGTGFIIALVKDFFDVTVKSVEFLEDLGLINLGMVYHISDSSNGRNNRVVNIIEDTGTNDMHRRV
ncbi:Wzz/FepE/Etk N-terminal domain-containing protein [Ligilactobacillus faecis]|uniref:Capsular polysaccharide biosynthesis protein CpsC n=1 Tax=Ligilactobacillus faecis TaxID=762833 RepID=A0ABV4DNM8_9LACO